MNCYTYLNVDNISCDFELNEDVAAEYAIWPRTTMPPIVVDDGNYIIDGTHRLEAAKLRGDKKIWAYQPC